MTNVIDGYKIDVVICDTYSMTSLLMEEDWWRPINHKILENIYLNAMNNQVVCTCCSFKYMKEI